MAAGNPEQRGLLGLPKIKGWFVILALLSFGIAYLYHVYQEKQTVFINNYYFRTLQEVATEFNNNLAQLEKLHAYDQSTATIQSIFTSYQKEPKPEETDSGKALTKYAYVLESNRIMIKRKDGSFYSVDIKDLLPAPQNDFVFYLIADANNRVLSSTGGAAGLSMIDTKVVSRAIQLKEGEDWIKLATRQGAEKPDEKRALPGYSAQIDVELNAGMSRVFVLPFHLYHSIGVAFPEDDENGNKGVQGGGIPLYLLGVQPETVVDSHDDKRWNLSLLLLSLVALVFVWTFARLLMLSRHQPLGNGFYRVTVAASCLTFILLVALLVAFAHQDSEIAIRQHKAKNLMSTLENGVSMDLDSVFSALKKFQGFYCDLLDHEKLKNSCDQQGDTTTDQYNVSGFSSEKPGATKGKLLLEDDKENLIIKDYDGFEEMSSKNFYEAVGDSVCATVKLDDGTELPRCSHVNIYGPYTNVKKQKIGNEDIKVSEWLTESNVDGLPAEGRLLSVFLMDGNGQQILPGFYFSESNQRPVSFSLAHRDYFRRVRDKTGWNLDLQKCERKSNKADIDWSTSCTEEYEPSSDCATPGCAVSLKNFYIQRLLNLNTGTRGSTIGLPLGSGSPNGDDVSGEYVLGADIDLPSLSYSSWDDPEAAQDMVVMVIDRVSGQVLYHMNHKRSMVENLYQAGQGVTKISHSIRSGRFLPVSGYYHGESGEFMANPLPIDQWAVVVFIPDASTDSLMTNTFLVSATGMSIALLIFALLLIAHHRFTDTVKRKKDWGVPAEIDRHSLMLFSSLLVSSAYLGYWLGEVIRMQTGTTTWNLPWLLSLLAVMIMLSWGYIMLQRARRRDRLHAQLEKNADRGTLKLLAIFFAAGLGVTFYLDFIGNKPDAGLTWYYENLYQSRLNQEKRELHDIALTRYPNSIKLHEKSSFGLLPIDPHWREALLGSSAGSGENPNSKQRHVSPVDVGTFSQYTSTTNAYQWLKIYLLGILPSRPDKKIEDASTGTNSNDVPANESADGWALARFIFVTIAAYLLLCGLWYSFFRLVIRARLVGQPGLTEHLQQIVEHNLPESAYAPRSDLVLDLVCPSRKGEDLTVLLNRCAIDSSYATGESSESATEDGRDIACRGMAMLLRECPWLKSGPDDPDLFPGVNIGFERFDTEGSQHSAEKEFGPSVGVRLSELDACLTRSEMRKSLLRLVRHLKAMCMAGKLAKFRINMGFHSYEALLLKAHNIESEQEPMTETEFADWAGTLMDFTVNLPKVLTAELDDAFVEYECKGSGLLRGLSEELLENRVAPPASWRMIRRWLVLKDVDKNGREWATINCILLKAGALFRHKWETCSDAEKMALYYLSRNKRINTANAQLLEQMALQGLIRMDHGRIRIISNSFAYFARHAEDTSTLKRLVEIAEVGAWQEFRLPVTLVILLLLGGIAFTSGSSLYMIAASLLGLLGTIGSLTSSAHMIKENLR